jgi:hypothetical protein
MIHNSNPLDLALSKGKCEAVFITQVLLEFFHHICYVSTGSPWTRIRMVLRENGKNISVQIVVCKSLRAHRLHNSAKVQICYRINYTVKPINALATL